MIIDGASQMSHARGSRLIRAQIHRSRAAAFDAVRQRIGRGLVGFRAGPGLGGGCVVSKSRLTERQSLQASIDCTWRQSLRQHRGARRERRAVDNVAGNCGDSVVLKLIWKNARRAVTAPRRGEEEAVPGRGAQTTRVQRQLSGNAVMILLRYIWSWSQVCKSQE